MKKNDFLVFGFLIKNLKENYIKTYKILNYLGMFVACFLFRKTRRVKNIFGFYFYLFFIYF